MYVLNVYQVLYQLANDEGKFSINATTGDVIVSESLDREVSSMYNLTVTAVDRGQPQKSAVQNILIDVLDVNDVIPMFERVCFHDATVVYSQCIDIIC